MTALTTVASTRPACHLDGCDRLAGSGTRGLCSRYLDAVFDADPTRPRCGVPACGRAARTLGLCQTHDKHRRRGKLDDAPAAPPATRQPPVIPRPRRGPDDAPPAPAAPPGMPADSLALLRLVVEESQGSILGSPSEVAREARRVAEAVGAPGVLPVTGPGLAAFLESHADQLATAGLLVKHTVRGELDDPWHTSWLALSFATADLAGRDAHPLPDVSGALVDKLEAVLRRLVADSGGRFEGTVNTVRLAWKRVPEVERDELAGPPWPATAAALDRALHGARSELARRGLAIERVGRGLVVLAGDDSTTETPEGPS